MDAPALDLLKRRRIAILMDMKLKAEAEDFHGVADCAMDLREIDAVLKALKDTHA